MTQKTQFAPIPEVAQEPATSCYSPRLHTVAQFSKANPAFTISALRNLIFHAEPRQSSVGEIPGNGLLEAGAIVRLGRKVMLDDAPFFTWIRRGQREYVQPNPLSNRRGGSK